MLMLCISLFVCFWSYLSESERALMMELLITATWQRYLTLDRIMKVLGFHKVWNAKVTNSKSS